MCVVVCRCVSVSVALSPARGPPLGAPEAEGRRAARARVAGADATRERPAGRWARGAAPETKKRAQKVFKSRCNSVTVLFFDLLKVDGRYMVVAVKNPCEKREASRCDLSHHRGGSTDLTL